MPINLSPQSESGKKKRELLTLICSILFSAFQLSQLIRGCSRCFCCRLQIELKLNLANHQKTRKTNVKRARHEQCIKIKKQRRRERERDVRVSEAEQRRVNNQVALLTARASVDNNKMKCNGHRQQGAGGEWQGKELQWGGAEEGGGVATVAGICKGFTEAT